MRMPKWFTGRSALQHPFPPLRFTVDRQLLFDEAKTRTLAKLLELPRGRREAAWTESFFDAAWNASLVVAEPAVITGRDGFPYVRLNLPPPGRFKPTAIANLAAICLERATGIALFASANDPVEASQYVFPPGMLDSLLRYDTWLGDPLDHGDRAAESVAIALEEGWGRTVALRDTQEILLGSPSVQFLPVYSARALLNHMRGAWGLADPRVRLMVDPALRPARSLVVGRRRSELASDTPWEVLRARLLWHLPKGRSVVLMPVWFSLPV